MEKPRKGSKGGRLTIYDDSFKLLVANDYYSGDLSMPQVARKHGLSEGTMYYFIKWYKAHQLQLTEAPKISSANLQNTQALSRELAAAKLKITALELLLSNAEREMGVDIVKKSGTKRSVK